MAIGRTNAGSGGSMKSAIIATAPGGSQVTCTKGSTVKTATEKPLGVPNLLKLSPAYSMTSNGVRFSVYEDRIELSGYKTAAWGVLSIPVSLPPGSYAMTAQGEVEGTDSYTRADACVTVTDQYGYTQEYHGSFTLYGTEKEVLFEVALSKYTYGSYSGITIYPSITLQNAVSMSEYAFHGLDLGTWAVKATKSGQSVTEQVTLNRLSVEYIDLDYFTATIRVTYPAGAICTCSDGSRTLTAPDTSGSSTFTVHKKGNWIVQAQQGSNSDSVTVNVAAAKDYGVELSFRLWLIKNGVESKYAQYSYYVNKTQGSGDVTFDNNANATDAYWVYAGVDLTGYNTVVLEGNLTLPQDNVIKFGVWDNNTSNPSTSTSHDVAIAFVKPNSAGGSLDVSSLSGEHKVGIAWYNYATYKVKNLYLTK